MLRLGTVVDLGPVQADCATGRIVVEYERETRAVARPGLLPINPELVWDFAMPDDGHQDEAFRRWYVARVLSRGRMEDVQDLGLQTIRWTGHIISVRLRIRLTRSFDEWGHSYLGYCVHLDGIIGDEFRVFSVGIGPATQQKHRFRVGDEVSGVSVPVADEQREPVETHSAGRPGVLERNTDMQWSPPPWLGTPPDLETYAW
jgi:hypothetical protein